MNIIQAVNSALENAMATNEDIVVLGDDVGKFGGVFRAIPPYQKGESSVRP